MLIVVLWNVSGSRILVLTTGRDMLVFILQCNIAQEISLEGSNVHKTELDAEVFPLIYRTHHPPMQHSSSRTTHTHTHTHSHTHTTCASVTEPPISAHHVHIATHSPLSHSSHSHSPTHTPPILDRAATPSLSHKQTSRPALRWVRGRALPAVINDAECVSMCVSV